ncbi:MAG TPA: cytochrome c [Tahibacter sp.]|uniref:c-type cytochrome n=1 Tax=Tahibacter sp. TaxID=2056211 RepID=UPI002CEED9F1|nr:cytochrome c [Tahibacter sp.]HSX59690.1 cytochrome c [Tahibacter sp.]
MNRLYSLLALAPLLAVSSFAQAAGNLDAGKKLAEPCAACHGADGNPTDPQYPRLSGQYRDYLQEAMHQYKNGKRKNAIMAGFMQPLTEQNIADLAAYFAQLPGGRLGDLSQPAKPAGK